VSGESQFCSSCGYRLIDTAESGKQWRESKRKLSPRKKGVRQGLFFVALSLLLIPAYILLAPLFPANDRLVESAVSDTPFEKISQTLIVTFFLVGLVRLLYARFFESGESQGEVAATRLDEDPALKYALPAAQGTPVSGFGAWRANTDELAKAPGVTERPTTSLDDA
jgi:hypothetical protein